MSVSAQWTQYCLIHNCLHCGVCSQPAKSRGTPKDDYNNALLSDGIIILLNQPLLYARRWNQTEEDFTCLYCLNRYGHFCCFSNYFEGFLCIFRTLFAFSSKFSWEADSLSVIVFGIWAIFLLGRVHTFESAHSNAAFTLLDIIARRNFVQCRLGSWMTTIVVNDNPSFHFM